MFPFDQILIGCMMAAAVVVLIVAFVLEILFKSHGITATATVIKIEENRKYKGKSNQKHTAYDYVYRYMDENRQTQTGKLIKNTPYREFAVGDKLEIIYIKFWPDKSMEMTRYRVLRFFPWLVAVMLFVLAFILFVSL